MSQEGEEEISEESDRSASMNRKGARDIKR